MLVKLKEIWDWISSIVFAALLALVLGVFVFQPFKVEGHSMDPTLHDQQRIYVSKLSHTFSYLPDYGDIVVIDSRVNRERTIRDDLMNHPLIHLMLGNQKEDFMYVKRVIGKPGDVLEFKNHQVYRNGKPLDEPYIKETAQYDGLEKVVVPDNHIFVMGDNRNNSRDSRDIGFIPLDHVIGTKLEWPF
ncbi:MULTISPECIES: signal peptidase I [Bacillales]|uniref:signal peptidase I n=1 Tax=Brevibacillus sp. NL20B1 TaxID=2829799 RepID=UPI00149126E4|nr:MULTISPECIES: signal peptidase I [Bacillales]MBR8661648.1 signal peptidase I [Brevibacillus sp. NL20B1]NNV04516.1 signal peptidase I [Brevibacillus sp. MCWH]UFJ62968.1 signal peptidase I [Anoxybacillus sediminis]